MINEKETIMLKFICYPKCTTCQKAKKWLDDNNIEYELRDIKENNPNFEELNKWYKKDGYKLNEYEIRYNDINRRFYIYARMYKPVTQEATPTPIQC